VDSPAFMTFSLDMGCGVWFVVTEFMRFAMQTPDESGDYEQTVTLSLGNYEMEHSRMLTHRCLATIM
jgi:hypothetical protein